MWEVLSHVEFSGNDLANLLGTQVFPTLSGDPAYVEIFRRAGFTGNLPTDLSRAPVHVLERLSASARLCAQLLRMDLESKTPSASGAPRPLC